MPRRHDADGWSENQVAELGAGRLMSGVVPPPSCTRPEWCPRCSTGWRCWSNFESRGEAERCWWDNRTEIMSMELLGNRPWSWWEWEAPRLCRHDPPCGLPDRTALDRSRRQHEWLDRHDLLSAEERVMLAMSGPPPDAGKLDDDA